jgi:hypothetical protein
MRRVMMVALAAFVTACAGDAGPMGPEGPQGPQGPQGPAGTSNRLVLSGVVSSSGGVSRALPSTAGTLTNPPSVSCFVSNNPTVVWIDVTSLSSSSCGYGQSGGTLAAVMSSVPVGWQYIFVVIW